MAIYLIILISDKTAQQIRLNDKMSIEETTFPKFVQQPIQTTSNWTQFKFPVIDQFRHRTLYKIVNDQGQPADPLLVQVPGCYGFVCPQGYRVVRVNFHLGKAIGAWLRPTTTGVSTEQTVYIQSRTTDKTIQDTIYNTTEPVSDGIFSFGALSAGVVNN